MQTRPAGGLPRGNLDQVLKAGYRAKDRPLYAKHRLGAVLNQPGETAQFRADPVGPCAVHIDTGMARLDPRMSRMKYRLERLMLTPLFRFSLRVVLPFALAFGGVTAWFSVEANRTAFTLMVADVQAAVQNRPEFQVKLMAIDGATEAVAEAIRAELALNLPMSSFDLDLDEMQFEQAMWERIQSLSDKDEWLSQKPDPTVSSNPAAPDFSLSFGGQAFFVAPRIQDLDKRILMEQFVAS